MKTESNFEFNDQQNAAIDKAVKWYRDRMDRKTPKKYFFIAGYAGTGKTSVALEITRRCLGDESAAEFVAPTGKAASRLRQKGCRGARTLHQFIYNVRGEDEEGNPIFRKKSELDNKPRLIVLDEGSMVGKWDAERLLDWGIPMLVLGDTGQVPPVKAAAYFTEGTEDVLLTDIERQGKDSNIIRASFFVRQGKRLPVREYDDVRVTDKKPMLVDLKKFMGTDSQILCTYNSTREYYNGMLRKICGHENFMPEPGEKIVCTFNQHGPGFMNGEQGIIKSYSPVPESELEDDEAPEMLYATIESLTDGRELQIKVNPACFNGDELTRPEAMKRVGGIDFGYVITIHKSQGSEWNNVVVLEEFMKGVPYAKLMYTAITRAAHKLWVYRA